ncbi:MAG: orotidine-5'-phosphate decarboxylase, partial [Thermoproteota archaeon]
EGKNLLNLVEPYLVGVKFGYPTILSFGLERVKEMVLSLKEKALIPIADAKIADVSHTNSKIAKILFKSGFDAVIAHGFMGFKGSLDGLSKTVKEENKALFILAAMSNDGASLIMDKVVEQIISESMLAEPAGFIVPATRPSMIKRVKELLPIESDLILLSPGVGAQGAPYGSAIANGAHFEIIGRSIYESKKPLEEVKKILLAQRSFLKG